MSPKIRIREIKKMNLEYEKADKATKEKMEKEAREKFDKGLVKFRNKRYIISRK